ncbi:MAG: radical SAM protein, partial [Chitinophagaceae bacterium]
VKEVVLTGINLGDFGKGAEGTKHNETFLGLIKDLETVSGIERFRISSIEPNLLTGEIIEFVSNSQRFMPHFHIPLQSGSNKILALMKRRYRRELYADKVRLIKLLMPHCCIGVDVIVGFPGETEEDFTETFSFLHELEISYLHVFTYSERNDTAALDLKPIVPIHVRNLRNKQLRNLSFMKMQAFTRRHEGETRKVLFEGHDRKSTIDGYTDNYIRIQTLFREDLVNQVKDWKI